MMCPKCGEVNNDDVYMCVRCGHKLQSMQGERSKPRQQNDSNGGGKKKGLVPELTMQGAKLGIYIEAWVYAIALLAAGVFLIVKGLAWPLYILVPLIGLTIALRRI
ncbi:zinc ribbon domain-containing protein [Desulfovibrio inopinatus]|uniref:zinc ribbon domain-containing protein n=1 Tax=Desulfovibrio inopinatus TaxID=102109 RepID=UPI000485B9D2|nr:zinc ribbon domain-containing protein [Desulfovibrio inopinatus]